MPDLGWHLQDLLNAWMRTHDHRQEEEEFVCLMVCFLGC